jgi:SAM-dependent methyltransferase
MCRVWKPSLSGPWVWALGIVPLLVLGSGRPTMQASIDPPCPRSGMALVSQMAREDRPKLDVIFVPTPQEVVDKMLEMAEIKAGDVLYDLGCGDGRIVITAAKRYGIKTVGIDLDPRRVKEARENVDRSGVADLVTIRQADLFETDLSAASVVTLYLLPTLNDKLKPKLARLKLGTRILSHSFAMKGAKPRQVVKVKTEHRGVRTVFLWIVPWEEEGA